MHFFKKVIVLITIIFVVSCKETKDKHHSHSIKVSDFIHEDGMVTDTMIEILGQSGVRIKGKPAKNDWPEMIAELDSPHCESVKNLIQGKDPRYPNYSWFAKPGVERWDMTYDGKVKDIKKLLNFILLEKVDTTKGLNMGAPTYPTSSNFSSILLLGSTLGDFQSRVNFLNKLVQEHKVTLDLSAVYILTGKRSFNDAEKAMLARNASTEALNVLKADSEKVGLEWIYNQSQKDASLSALPVKVIDDAHPRGLRATTESTAALFFNHTAIQTNKKILGVSTHIFALYHYLILKRVAFQNGFTGEIEICAPALYGSERNTYPDSKKLAMLLDNIARIFYEICAYKKMTGKYPS